MVSLSMPGMISRLYDSHEHCRSGMYGKQEIIIYRQNRLENITAADKRSGKVLNLIRRYTYKRS